MSFSGNRNSCTKMFVSLLNFVTGSQIILPLLKDTVRAVMDRLYTVSHNQNDLAVADFLRVFLAIAKCLKQTDVQTEPNEKEDLGKN